MWREWKAKWRIYSRRQKPHHSLSSLINEENYNPRPQQNHFAASERGDEEPTRTVHDFCANKRTVQILQTIDSLQVKECNQKIIPNKNIAGQ